MLLIPKSSLQGSLLVFISEIVYLIITDLEHQEQIILPHLPITVVAIIPPWLVSTASVITLRHDTQEGY